jgi:hypothetical protein
MLLGCQRIHQRILAKESSALMVVDSGGGEGLQLDEEVLGAILEPTHLP